MENIINRKFKIEDVIGNGKFGIVYKGINVRTKEIVAIKTEGEKCIYKLLKRETTILNHLFQNHCKNIPYIYWYGRYNQLSCLIMTHYEYNLKTFFSSVDVSQEEIYEMFKKCICIIESIHKCSIIHRDIKPDNFMIKNDDVYLIDFGLALFYRNEDNNHIRHFDEDNIVGTPNYVSYFNHCGEPQSRRDDLLSLGYMCLLFLNGQLQWENISCTNSDMSETSLENPKNKVRKKMKEFNNLQKICNKEMIKYFDKCYSLCYDDNPDYDQLSNIFNFD